MSLKILDAVTAVLLNVVMIVSVGTASWTVEFSFTFNLFADESLLS